METLKGKHKVKDYYKLLELELGASLLEIKKAYRRLALRLHPDRSNEPNAAQNFMEITEAYEVLRDPMQKSEYDRLYLKYFRPKTKEQFTEQAYEHTNYKKQQEWETHGREKAKEYSTIPFEEFARMLLKEISVGASYIPNSIAIIFTGGTAIVLLVMLPDTLVNELEFGLFSLLMIAGLGYLAYRLFLVAQADYKEDRKRKIPNN